MTEQDVLKAIEGYLPGGYYANLPVEKRVQYLANAWRRAINVNKQLDEQVTAYNSVVAMAQAVLQEYYRTPDHNIELYRLERVLDEVTPDWTETLLEWSDGWVRCKRHSKFGEWFGVLRGIPEDHACWCIKAWRNKEE